MKKNLLIMMCLVATGLFAQSAGFNTTYVVLSVNGGPNTYYDLNAVTGNPDFNNQSLGTFCQGSSGLVFKGAEHNVYKCGGCDLSSTRIYYRIYQTGTSPGSFVSNNIGHTSGFNNGCGGQDQMWSNTGYSTNLLSGLASGNYTIEIYSDATVSCSGGTIYASNGGANYKATFTVNATSVGGNITGTQSVCSGSTPTNLALGSNTGNVTKWQRSSSSDFTSGVTDIANTTTTLTGAAIGPLTATTYFRAVVTNGVCASANSSVATITVNAQSVGGSVSGNQTICNSSTPSDLTLSGHTGSVTKWQRSSSSDFTTGVTDISNTTATLPGTSIGPLTATTYFRAVVTSGVCTSANSSGITITVSPATVGGTVSGSADLCETDNSGTLVLSGHTGNIIKWQSSTFSDFSAGIIDISNTSANLDFSDILQTTYYRAIVKSGVCSETVSSSAVVAINSNIWTGEGEDMDWNNAENWSCGVVPTETQRVVIEAAGTQPVISGGITANALSLVIEEGASLTIMSGNTLMVVDAIAIDEDGIFTVQDRANLIQVNDVSNTGDIQVEKLSAPIFRLDYALWSSPVAGETLIGFSPETIASRFYRYNTATNTYTASGLNDGNVEFAEGVGYLIRVANTHPDYDAEDNFIGAPWAGTFAGIPNNGTISVDALAGFNAVGNPYPSAINIAAFYEANESNLAEDAALFFWRKKNGLGYSSYASLTLEGYTANGQLIENANGDEIEYGDASGGLYSNPAESDEWALGAAQGFIVYSNGNDIVFTNDMRVTETNTPQFRSAQDAGSQASRIWLNIAGPSGEYHQTMVSYSSNGTLGLDYARDGRALTDSDMSLYSLAGETKLGIQARPEFDASDVVPLGYKTTNPGTYTILLDHADGIFSQGQQIYLMDNLLGTTHNLTESGYGFFAEEGIDTSRFNIVYAAALGDDDAIWSKENILVYKENNRIIINSGEADVTAVAIFDTRGRLLYSEKEVNPGGAAIDSLQPQQQVLVVQITTPEGTISKKLVY